MAATIFYAWQSDRPAQTHRCLIHDAASQAAKQLSEEPDIEEAPRIDHDTKDVPGTPEIAASIFKKIDSCAVFLADLTFIGTAESDGDKKKLIPNPNVMLELGYA